MKARIINNEHKISQLMKALLLGIEVQTSSAILKYFKEGQHIDMVHTSGQTTRPILCCKMISEVDGHIKECYMNIGSDMPFNTILGYLLSVSDEDYERIMANYSLNIYRLEKNVDNTDKIC